MKIYASGEDYLEAVLVLQKEKAWFAPLTLPDTWDLVNRVSAMQ